MHQSLTFMWVQQSVGSIMVIISHFKRWWVAAACWLSSFLVHFAALSVLSLCVLEVEIREPVTLFVSTQPREEIEDVDLTFDITFSDPPMAEFSAPSLGALEERAEIHVPEPPQLTDTSSDISELNVALMDFVSNDSNTLMEDLAGIRGGVVNARGDRGSVTRITGEILSRLESSEVLVAWLMDASESLRPRREQIIQHFNRVYEELDMVAGNRGDSVLTSVAAFGKELVFVTPKPTVDRHEITRAVRNIKADKSGVENVFSAIKATALKYSSVARNGRKVMIIVVTDESGDDLHMVDDVIAQIKRQEMWVYVMGPLAPFARDEIKVKWTDEENGETYFLPVDRGPETAYIEHAKLGVWQNGPGSSVVASGFGPYGLTRVTHESGGLYLLSDEDRIPGPRFDVDRLRRYRPDYVSTAEYRKQANENPLRMAVLRISKATNELFKEPLPTQLLAAGIQFGVRRVSRQLANTMDALNRTLSGLAAVEQERAKEISPRWRAHYDLLKARVLANRVRCYSYVQLLTEMYHSPQVPKDGTKNAWKLAATERPNAVKMPAERQRDADLARELLQRVVKEHSDTPWAVIAKAEMEYPLSFQWQEAFIEPPVGVPLPWDKKPWSALTEAQKKAKIAFDKKKKDREKRKRENVVKSAEKQKRPPPKL